MRFPEKPRVIYRRNLLESVICQLRFPPILKINSEPPAEFQERVRANYPLLKERGSTGGAIALPPEIVKLLGQEVPMSVGNIVYDFISADELWQISLSRDFIALTAKQYQRWEGFRDRLLSAMQHFQEIYAPAFYSRIGLRYRNIINRDAMGLKDVEWVRLLEPHIAAELGTDISPHLRGFRHESAIALESGQGEVKYRHGLIQKEGEEPQYFIDADFFTNERTGVNDARSKLDYFNGEAGRFFRWCISQRLDEAMGPQRL